MLFAVIFWPKLKNTLQLGLSAIAGLLVIKIVYSFRRYECEKQTHRLTHRQMDAGKTCLLNVFSALPET